MVRQHRRLHLLIPKGIASQLEPRASESRSRLSHFLVYSFILAYSRVERREISTSELRMTPPVEVWFFHNNFF